MTLVSPNDEPDKPDVELMRGDEIPGQYAIDGAPPAGALSLQASSFSGPLPPWQQFDGYERVLSGSAERILSMAEREQAHAIEMNHRSADLEDTLQEKSVAIVRRGQWQGFVLAAILLVGAIVLLAMGADIGGLAALGTALAAIVGVYAIRYRNHRVSPTPDEPEPQELATE